MLAEGAGIRRGVDAGLLEKERSLDRQLSSSADRWRKLLSLKQHSPQQEEELAREIDQIGVRISPISRAAPMLENPHQLVKS